MSTDKSYQNRWSPLIADASRVAAGIITDRPSFQLRLGWPDSYESLLSSHYSEIISENVLLDRAIEGGRALLVAEAGSGKTWLLARLMQRAVVSRSAIPVLIQLRNLAIDEPTTNSADIDYVIRNLLDISTPDPRPVLALPDDAPPLVLMIDGLNEVPRRIAEPIIAAADELARRFPFLCVIVADRLVRRSVDLERWTLATVLPLSDDEVQRVWGAATGQHALPQDVRLLNRPFFLNTAIETDIAGSSEADTIRRYFTQVVETTAGQLDLLSSMGYRAYSEYSGRTMPENFVLSSLGESLYIQLKESDAMRASNGRTWFTHHLLHDFLAARSLSSREAEWGPAAFDVVTFTAASFDSLRLTVEQIENINHADRLVRLIYDWSYYGAAYALVEGYVPEETRVVILAMLADKRWDTIRATVTQVTDALRLDGSNIAEQFLSARNRSEIFYFVRELNSDQRWYQDWVALFTTPDNSPADAGMVDGLRNDDSITSWTLANVLRRCVIDQVGILRLLAISADHSAVIRWRAVHVLGAVPSERSLSGLRSRLVEDPDKWVRYGAVRSIVELAARASEDSLRDAALSILTEQLQQQRFDEAMLRELGRALDVLPQPDGWVDDVAPLIQQLVGLSASVAEQDRWGRLMTAIVSRSDASL